MKTILTSILVINLFDLISTLALVQGGFAYEANPLMASLISNSAILFALIKLILVSSGVWILYSNQNNKTAYVAAYASLAAYLFVMGVHFNVFANVVQQ